MTATYEEVHTTHRIGLDTDIDVDDLHGADFDGYYTIKLIPVRCGCGHMMEYTECNTQHVIVVWEEKDDEHLLHAAAQLKKAGGDPKVVDYEADMGKCIDFYVAREKKYIG